MRIKELGQLNAGAILGYSVTTEGNIYLPAYVPLTQLQIEDIKGEVSGVVWVLEASEVRFLFKRRMEMRTFYEDTLINVFKSVYHSSWVGTLETFESLKPLLKSWLEEDPELLYTMYRMREAHYDTYVHSIYVASYALIYGLDLEDGTGVCTEGDYNPEQLKYLFISGLLHDVGKLYLDKAILNAPRKLTEDEFYLIRMHPSLGLQVLRNSNIKILKNKQQGRIVEKIVLQHHEKCNGEGYPNNVLGDDLPRASKVVAVCDIFDACNRSRVYRKTHTVEKALEILESDLEKGLLDRETVLFFKASLNRYPTGSTVLLSNYDYAVIELEPDNFFSARSLTDPNITYDLQQDVFVCGLVRECDE